MRWLSDDRDSFGHSPDWHQSLMLYRGLNFPTRRAYRYRMTVNVLDNFDTVRSGSSVIEIKVHKQPIFGSALAFRSAAC